MMPVQDMLFAVFQKIFAKSCDVGQMALWGNMDNSPGYRQDVDGLRAVAVLAVVIFHAFPTLMRGGFVGVDVFFVISGFLITGIIHKGLRSNHFSFSDFWARRIRRILPALLTVIVATFLAGWWYLLPMEFDALKSHIKWGLGFAANFKLNSEVGYFDTAAELKPLLHLWSLAIEEQFYFVWPGFLWICFRKDLNLFTATLVLAFASFMCCKFVPHASNESFYLPWARFWELQSGALIAIWQGDYSGRFRAHFKRLENKIWSHLIQGGRKAPRVFLCSIVAAVGAGLILYSSFKFTKETPFPSKFTLLPVLGAVLIIMAGKSAWFNRTILSLRPVRFVGLISFPLYLWHWPILSYTRIVFDKPSTSLILLAIFASLALSVVTYFTVEKNLRYEDGSWQWRAPALATSLCMLIGFSEYPGIVARSSQFGLDKINAAIGKLDYPGKSMVAKSFPNGLSYFEVRTNVPRYVLFIGDSHMQQYAPRVEKISAENPNSTFSSIWVTNGGCLFVDGMISKEAPVSCEVTTGKLAQVIAAAQEHSIEKVVWTQAWSKYLEKADGQQIRNGVELVGPEKLDARKAGIEARISSIRKKLPLVILLDTPYGTEFDPRSMVRRGIRGFRLGKDFLARSEVVNRQFVARNCLQDLATKYEAIVVDPSIYLCKDERCYVRDTLGRPFQKDSNHFTPYAAQEFFGYIDFALGIPARCEVKPNFEPGV